MSLTPTLRLFLKIIFRLKYLEGIHDTESLSAELGLPLYIVDRYVKRLDEYLQSKLNVITPERLEYVCPECLEARIYVDPENGEHVCANCGYVLPDCESYATQLPFDTTYALISELAYGKSLGGSLGYKGFIRVLAKSPSTKELAKQGNAHLGTRARLAQIITETVEPPPIRKALRTAKDLVSKYRLETEYVFNNFVGLLIKRAYYFSHYLAGSLTFKQKLPETCFWIALKKFGKANLAYRFLEENEVNHALAIALEELQSFLDDVKQRGCIRKKVLQTLPTLTVIEA